jgi:hypothetical protein
LACAEVLETADLEPCWFETVLFPISLEILESDLSLCKEEPLPEYSFPSDTEPAFVDTSPADDCITGEL